ncbi:MAG: hypothetical protein RJA21_1775, partial [Gemmatimonadota bacterium]
MPEGRPQDYTSNAGTTVNATPSPQATTAPTTP